MAEEGNCQTEEGHQGNGVGMKPPYSALNGSNRNKPLESADPGEIGEAEENMQEDSGLGDDLAEGAVGKLNGESGESAKLGVSERAAADQGEKMNSGNDGGGAGHGLCCMDQDQSEDNKNLIGSSVANETSEPKNCKDKDMGDQSEKMANDSNNGDDAGRSLARMVHEQSGDSKTLAGGSVAGETSGDENDNAEGGEQNGEEQGMEDSDDEDDDGDDECGDASRQGAKRENEGPASETDDDDYDSDTNIDDREEETQETDVAEHAAFVGELFKKPFPIPAWNPLLAQTKRQLGDYKTPWAFSHDVIGSHALVQRFERYTVLEGHEGCVNTLHFNGSGDRLASGSDDLKIAIWDWACKKTVLLYDSGHKRNVFQAKFMPNSGDTTIVSCARDGQVRVGELSSTGVCKATRRVAQHKAPAHKLALEVDSPVMFMTCGEDAVVWNVDLRESKPHKAITVKEGETKVPLYTIHLNPSNKNEFIVGGRDKYVRVYDRRKVLSSEEETALKKFCPHHLQREEDNTVNVTCSVYSYDGQEILVSYNDDDIYLFDNTHSDGADYVHRYQGHRNNATVKGVNFYGARSEFVVSGSDCGNVFLWCKDTERLVQLVHGDDGGVVNCLEPHPSAPILATSGLDHDVKIWMPTSEDVADMGKHKKTLVKNRTEREEERHREPSHLESQMFRFLLHHLRRSNRRQALEEGDDLDSDNDSSSEDLDSDDEDEEESAFARQMACNPS